MADYTAQIAKARKAGYSDAEIIGFLSQKDPRVQQAKGAGYTDAEILGKLAAPAKAPAKPAPKPTATGDAAGFMSAINRGLGVGDELAGAGYAARNILSGRAKIDPLKAVGVLRGLSDPLAGARAIEESGIGAALRGGMAEQRAIEDEFAARRPKTAALGRGVGMAATVPLPGGQVGQAMQGGRAMNVLRGATAAAAPAAAMSFADRGTVGERLKSANVSAVVGGLLGAGGGALARTPPKPVKVSPEVELLASEGVRMTPGRISGSNVLRSAEEAATSLPMVGQEISERTADSFGDFNRALLNRSLKQVGEKLPDDVATGTEAVKYVGDKLSKGYEDAIPGKVITADAGLSEDIARALDNTSTLTPESQKRLLDILTERIDSRVPKTRGIDGRTYKQIQSELDYEVSRFSKSTDPDQRAIGDAIAEVQKALEATARRQDPAFAKKIDALDRGWAELVRIETAAAKSQDLSGRFTPAQYRQALTAGEGTVRKRGVARGEALSQDLASAALKVLPSRIPDSGTAGRSAWGLLASAPGAALGAVAGGGPGALMGIAGTAAGLKAASRAYTPEAIDAANRALNTRLSPKAQQAALDELRALAERNAALGDLYRQVAARLGVGVSQNTLAGASQ